LFPSAVWRRRANSTEGRSVVAANREDPRIRVLGLLADPDLPAELAEELAGELPHLLQEHLGDRVAWEVRAVCEPFAAGEVDQGKLLAVARQRLGREGWDLAVCLTDLPFRSGRRPLVADLNAADGVALVSVPALGAMRLRRRARQAIVRLVGELLEEPPDVGDRARPEDRGAGLAGPVRRVPPGDQETGVRFVASTVRGRARLVAGMVRANRPWRLMLGLSSALAAALATSAFGLTQDTIWQLADALGPWRLSLAALGSIVSLVVWLVADHELWERRSGRAARSGQPIGLYNTATVITLTLGVVCLYAALLVLNLVAAMVFVVDDVLAETLRHPVGVGDHALLAWMTTSAAVVGSALGSGLESDEAVRSAAYGNREAERRARHDDGATM
jgi:hypothetical protein